MASGRWLRSSITRGGFIRSKVGRFPPRTMPPPPSVLFNRSYSPAVVRTALPTRFALRGRLAEARARLKSPGLRVARKRRDLDARPRLHARIDRRPCAGRARNGGDRHRKNRRTDDQG